MPNTLISKAEITERAKWAKRYTRENKRCAEIIRKALKDIHNAARDRMDYPRKPLRTREDYETALTDLLTNARHFADSKNLDYFELDGTAHGHYTSEVVQARTGVAA